MNVQTKYEGSQSLFKRMGSDGCHFLVLCSIIEEATRKPIDVLELARQCIDCGLMQNDFTVLGDGTQLLEFVTHLKWTRKEVVKLPVIRDNDYTEAIWYNPRTGYHHYRRRYFDTLDCSITVKEGYIEKYYIYTVQVA